MLEGVVPILERAQPGFHAHRRDATFVVGGLPRRRASGVRRLLQHLNRADKKNVSGTVARGALLAPKA